MESKRKILRDDEEAATIKANEAQVLKSECERDLAEAIPALKSALSALNTLKVRNPSNALLLCTTLIYLYHLFE